MHGATVYGKILEADQKRKKWVEKEGENEILMSDCGQCGKPQRRGQVICFNELEIKKWKEIGETHFKKTRSFTLIFMLIGVFLIIAPWIIFHKPFVPFGIAVILLFLLFIFFIKKLDQSGQKGKKEKKQILSAHGNIPLDEIGMVDGFPQKYIILPVGDTTYDKK
jgi:predicted nucleic acid-binding Zn ribbon protein